MDKKQTTNTEEKISFKVNCSKCGEATEVPFKPMEGRAVYCRTCYSKMRSRY